MSQRAQAILGAAFIASAAFAGASHAQDAANGEKLFKSCKSCHAVGDGARNKSGPVLTDVIGRTAGTFAGYKYSKSLRTAGEEGLVWDEAQIIAWLENPSAYLKDRLDDPKAKAKMGFKLKSASDRADIAAYLASFQTADAGGDICVTNGSELTHFFAAEAHDGARDTAELAPGETLCVAGADTGVVSVFENATHFEGCSRLVSSNSAEQMLRYSDFDRCAWSSNTG